MTYTPLSTNTYLTTSPNETNFTVTWNSPYYLETEDVYAKVNGAAWTVVSVTGTTVVLDTGIPANANVFIYRDTDISENVANFSAGSTFRAQDLNKNYDQLLFKVQENQDIANKAQGEIDIIDNTLSGIALYIGLANTADLNTAAATLIANPSSTNIRYEVSDSTNIDGSVVTPPTTNPAPLPVINSLPSGVNWNSGIATRVIWNGSSWDFNVYVPYDPDGRYLENGEVNLATTKSSTSNVITNTAGTDATLVGASGTDAGLLSSADKTKLDGIETAATADQTGAEIKALYEVEANAFTDTQFTKLAGIETGATADQTAAEIRTLVGSATDSNVFTDADHTKLDGIEAGATTDQTGAEIKTLYESQADTNAFTDADHTKLDGISSGATVSQWSNVSSGISYGSGNVGIGTSSPTRNLVVNNSSGNAFIAVRGVDTGIAGILLGDQTADTPGQISYSNSAESMQFLTAASEKMRITSGGNVGIGTSSPTNLLHIYDDAGANDKASLKIEAYLPKIRFQDRSTSSASAEISGDNALKFNISTPVDDNTSLTERMRITNAGLVGIGTTSPGAKLEVVDGGSRMLFRDNGSASELILKSEADGVGSLYFGDTADTVRGGIVFNSANDSLNFHGYNNTSRMSIISNGNIGIGTASPQDELHINTGVYTANQDGGVRFSLFSGTTEKISYRAALKTDAGGTNRFAIDRPTNDSGGTTEALCILNNGNVGIGTTAPTARLTQVGGHFQNNRPSDFWSNGDYIDVSGYGGISTQGSFELDIQANGYRNSSGTWTRLNTNGQVGAAKISLNPTGYIKFSTEANKANGSSSGITERARIHQDGSFTYSNVSINPVASNVNGIAFRTFGNIITCMQSVNAPHQFRRNNDGDIIRFYRDSTTDCGAIRVTAAGGTHFDTSSDYRLKENIVAIVDGIDRVKKLQPKRFNFIESPENTVDGFIAHEAQLAVPDAVSGEKDETEEQEYEVTPAVVDEDGNITEPAIMGVRNVPKYQAIDQSKLVPLLTAALQEAIAKIETLEQRLSDAGIA